MRGSLVLTAVLSLVIAFRANAQELGEDEVALKNGGSIRGTVVAVAPGESVKIIEMGSTTPRTIQWAEVAEVQKGKYAKKTTVEPGSAGKGYSGDPPAKPERRSAPPEQSVDGRGVRIHIESPKPATLMHVAAVGVGQVGNYIVTTALVEPVCTSPCDEEVRVESGGNYYITGDGFPNTSPFVLDSTRDSNIVVEPGSSPRRGGGWAMVTLGATAALAGVGVLLVSPILLEPDCTLDANLNETCTEVDSTPVFAGAGAAIGIGVATLVGGVVLVATSGTHARVEDGVRGTAGTVAPWIDTGYSLTRSRYSTGEPPVELDGAVFGVRGTF